MKNILAMIITSFSMHYAVGFEQVISFDGQLGLEHFWSPLSDQVRGGKSTIFMEVQDDQTGRIFGELKLNEQGAGFASYRVMKEDNTSWDLQKNSSLNVVSRGDGRTYKLLIKDNAANLSPSDYSWQAEIPTASDFQTTFIKFTDLKPIYRGVEMENMKPLDPSQIVEFGFQINDKTEGAFEFFLKSLDAL